MEAQHEVREHAGDASGDDDAERAQQHRGHGDGFGAVDVGVKAAVEHDEQQRRTADGFGERVVAKVDVHRPVNAQQHAERNKDEQGGEGELFADGFDSKAQNDDEADKKEVSGSWVVSRSWVVCVARSIVCGYLYPKMVGLWGRAVDVRIFDTW